MSDIVNEIVLFGKKANFSVKIYNTTRVVSTQFWIYYSNLKCIFKLGCFKVLYTTFTFIVHILTKFQASILKIRIQFHEKINHFEFVDFRIDFTENFPYVFIAKKWRFSSRRKNFVKSPISNFLSKIVTFTTFFLPKMCESKFP